MESFWRRFELPTWGLMAVIYGGWLGLTWSYHDLPWWIVAPAGGWLLAWHMSLQHEALHGHPTRSHLLNGLLAGAPLALWLPYPIYRDSHLAHHRDRYITDPLEDPESYYLTPERWAALPAPARGLVWAHHTLLGRLLLGPPWLIVGLLRAEARRLRGGDYRYVGAWLVHLGAVAGVLGWVIGICAIPWWAYLLLFVYPGCSLTLLRSYAEHRPDGDPRQRTVVTESGLFGVLFLHNNLHVVHHRFPRLPWYAIPAVWRCRGTELLGENGGHLFRGYREQLWRYGLRAKDHPVHPSVGLAERRSGDAAGSLVRAEQPAQA